MTSRVAALAWIFLVLASPAHGQSAEQAIELYRKAVDLSTRGDFPEALRLCEDLAKARADKEGVLRVRVGAGLEDREFEPRRLAGDACAKLARTTVDLDERLKLFAQAARWYQASAELGLTKAGPLLEQTRAEVSRIQKDKEAVRGAEATLRRLEALKSSVSQLLTERSYAAAAAEIDKARASFPGDDKALDALKEDVDASFLRWQSQMTEELREDLATFRTDRALADLAKTVERFSRYQVPAERVLAARRDPTLAWAASLVAMLRNPDAGDELAEEGLRFGFVFFRVAEELTLERLARAVKDPGPNAPLDTRWASVIQSEAAFTAAARRARERIAKIAADGDPARSADFGRWQKEDLAGLERRVSQVRGSLPEQEAPRAIDLCLTRLDEVSLREAARPEGYADVEADLERLLPRTGTDPALQAKIKAGQAVARALGLFLKGSTREEVLAECRERLTAAVAADPASLRGWKEKSSPRVVWILDQIRP